MIVPKAVTKPKREMKVRIPRNAALARFFLGPVGRGLVIGFCAMVILGVGVLAYFYHQYSSLISDKLQNGFFANSAKIYASPESVAVGDVTTPLEIAAELRRSGYSESHNNAMGYYQVHPNAIEVFPGRDSYFDQEPGIIRFSNAKITQIISLQDNTPRPQYQLEPQLITAVSGPNREKRRLVKFRDIPQVLVQALTSAEDKRFFQHAGFDPIGLVRAIMVDLRQGRKDQGASTLSMQLARMFFLTQDKRWKRKMAEFVITLQLEQKLSKQEIFEAYANQIYLGWRGTYKIHGFGEAAEAFLGKDLSQINVPEAAELAGLARWPAYFDPFHHPDHTRDRRNVVLKLMHDNGYINDRDYALAVESPLTVAKGGSQSIEAPYFVDMVNEALQNKWGDEDFQSNAFRIYTTLDMNLQRAATDAVRKGMELVDQQIRKQRRFKNEKNIPLPQVALVAIDPHTGEVKALAGGRNYGVSQLNHVLAKRQPGSIFKPFVYAAAMDTGVQGGPHILTPSTMILDQPTTFWFDGKPYEPSNFEHKFYGDVTIRQALAKSLNVATVKVAEMVGYDSVVDLAHRAGMNEEIYATPAVALGSYVITPLEAVGAYTIFANHGDMVQPSFLRAVRTHEGKLLFRNKEEQKRVLDPRVAYLMTNLMEEVIRTGTAAGVRAKYNLNFPAAGKTGTSHDGWFAGYTSELLCVVWVGFDDNRTIDLEGAHSAAPIWAEFMSQAIRFREYRDVKQFAAPDGIVSVEIDPQSGMLATPNCPNTRAEVYIAGTQPVSMCPLHGGGRTMTNVAGWDTAAPPKPAGSPVDSMPRVSGSGSDGQVQPGAVTRRATRQERPEPPPTAQTQPSPEKPKQQEKKGLFRRLIGVFK